MLELSSLTRHFDVPTNPLYKLKEKLARSGEPFVDLVAGNPTAAGIQFPLAPLKKALADAASKARVYQPDPLGQHIAREAVSRFYARADIKIPASQIVITPGTSLSFWYAFRILADAGDEFLVPSPSYPLFDSIAQMAGIKLIPYRLHEHERWAIDMESVETAITARTRAIILISPHNPTGSVASEDDIRALSTIAARRNIAIISDEVFSPFLFKPKRLPRPAEHGAPLVITLNGFSKMLALPGMKIGWMALTGDEDAVKRALKALDMISDTLLPVNEIAQFAAPALLEKSLTFQKGYVAEIRRRMELAVELLEKSSAFSIIRPEGGFYLTLAIRKHGVDEEELACGLLNDHRVLVHPGYFYDMTGKHLVFSFTSEPAILRKALSAVMTGSR